MTAAKTPKDVGALRKRWAGGAVYIGLGMDIWDQSSDDDSLLFRLRIGSSFEDTDLDTKFQIDKDGNVTATAFIGDGSQLTGISGGGGGGTIVNDGFAGSWDGDTTQGASRNALYDKFILVDASVTSEAGTRLAADNALDARLDAIEADYTTDTELTTALSSYVTTTTYNAFVTLVDQSHIAYTNATNTFTATQTTRSIAAASDSTYDIGTTGVRFANGYFDSLPGVDIQGGTCNTESFPPSSGLKIASCQYVADVCFAYSLSYQPVDADLITIASLTATTDNFMQAKSNAWASRTPTQVTADLIAMVGDTGTGGSKGLVPAPAAGDAAAGKFLKADGVWTVVGGSVSDTAYNAGTWDAVVDVAPSKNAVRDKFVSVDAAIAALVSDTAYDATTWNSVVDVAPSKNAVRDKFALVDAAIAALVIPVASDVALASSWNANTDVPTKNVVYDAVTPRSISFGAAAGANTTVYLTTYARFACTIDSIQNIQTTSGTISLAVKINGTNVTGLSAVAVTSSSQDVNASAANAVAIGDEITLVWSSNASAVDIRGTLLLTRTG